MLIQISQFTRTEVNFVNDRLQLQKKLWKIMQLQKTEDDFSHLFAGIVTQLVYKFPWHHGRCRIICFKRRIELDDFSTENTKEFQENKSELKMWEIIINTSFLCVFTTKVHKKQSNLFTHFVTIKTWYLFNLQNIFCEILSRRIFCQICYFIYQQFHKTKLLVSTFFVENVIVFLYFL